MVVKIVTCTYYGMTKYPFIHRHKMVFNVYFRPPGIYKQDYLEELYKRYDDAEFTPAAPSRPDWCNGIK